jgi:integrase
MHGIVGGNAKPEVRPPVWQIRTSRLSAAVWSREKRVPAHHDLIEALREWHHQTPYQSLDNWVFASPVNQGRWPYLAQEIMRHHIRPVSRKLGITKRIGWHTFRHYAESRNMPNADFTMASCADLRINDSA